MPRYNPELINVSNSNTDKKKITDNPYFVKNKSI